jgi:hypothetical protein
MKDRGMLRTRPTKAIPRTVLAGVGRAVSTTRRWKMYQWTLPMMMRTMLRNVRKVRQLRISSRVFDHTVPPGSPNRNQEM